MRPANRAAVRALVVLAAAVAAGCASAPPQPESLRDPDANFADYATFGWAPAPRVGDADPPLSLLDRHVRDAIAAELRRRGYVESADNPDLWIAYDTASRDTIENNPVRVSIGVGHWGGSAGGSVSAGTPGVREGREGTLVIHAIDAGRNAEVWQGRISTAMTPGRLEPAAVASAVATALRDFPPRPSSR